MASTCVVRGRVGSWKCEVDVVETLVLDISNSGTDTLFVDSVFVQDTLSGFSVAIAEGRTSSRIANILHPFLSKESNHAVSVNQGGVDNQNPTNNGENKGSNTIQDSRGSGDIQISETLTCQA